MILFFVLLLFLVLAVASYPAWPYSAAWGYFPFSILAILFILLIALIMTKGTKVPKNKD
jgi:hypothetical protein